MERQKKARLADITGDFTAMDANQATTIQAGSKAEQSATGGVPSLEVVLRTKELARQRQSRYRRLSELNRDKGKLQQSLRCLEKALYIALNFTSSDRMQIASDLELLATIAYQQGNVEISQSLIMRSKRMKEQFES